MGEAIVITSGKGGVGKTTTTANLGTALSTSREKSMLSGYGYWPQKFRPCSWFRQSTITI